MSTALVCGTSGFHRAAVAGSGNCTVFHNVCLLFSMKRNQELSLRTGIGVMDGIIGEVSQSIIASALPSLSERNVGMDMGVLDGLDVLDSSIGHISGDLIGPVTPPEEHMPEQVKHGLIVHHLARHHQDRQDNAPLASVYDVVGVVA